MKNLKSFYFVVLLTFTACTLNVPLAAQNTYTVTVSHTKGITEVSQRVALITEKEVVIDGVSFPISPMKDEGKASKMRLLDGGFIYTYNCGAHGCNTLSITKTPSGEVMYINMNFTGFIWHFKRAV